jgi:GTPase SAR1 family protein
VEYWLTIINAYSQNAPVILVGNKCDQHEMDVEKRRLREKYPNIRGFVSTSASTGEHIAELRQKIQEEVRAMPQVRVLFSADYLAVKDEMETLTAAHISHEEFVNICERHGVSDAKDQDTLLDLLHDLGTVLYFRDKDGNPLLPALGVLNPNWVTRGVYLIVTHPSLKDKFKGKLTMTLLREILSAPEYSRHIEDIAKLLERFELCYRADDSSYWLPSLMEKDEPAALGDFTSGLTSAAMKFTYEYPELPRSVIVRFIVKAHKMILDNQVWRYGAVLKLDGNTALVRADERDKRVSIFIAGEESTRRDALAILRAHFDDIHTMFATPPEAYIYPPQYPDLRLPFADMKTLAKTEREHKAVYQGKPVTINLRELLDGFVTPQERRKDEEREKDVPREVHYHQHNDRYEHIEVGGNVSNSILNAGSKNQISQTISNADIAPELKDMLLQLTEAVNQILPALTEAESRKVEKNLKKLVEEASESEPDKEWYSVSIEGLIQAARNLNELGAPVIDLAGKILKLLNGLP